VIHKAIGNQVVGLGSVECYRDVHSLLICCLRSYTSSKRFKDLIAELQERYEVIIIDSAPALAVSDALVVLQLADAQVMIIRD